MRMEHTERGGLRRTSFFDTEPITLTGTFDSESLEKLKELCNTPDEIKRRMLEVMQYMIEHQTTKISFVFKDGISFTAEIGKENL